MTTTTTTTSWTIRNGYLCPSNDGDNEKVLLLATTEKLLTILGYDIPSSSTTTASPIEVEGRGMLAALLPPLLPRDDGDGKTAPAVEEAKSEEEGDVDAPPPAPKEEGGPEPGSTADDKPSATPTPAAAPKPDDAKFQKLRRIQNSPDAVFRALDDIRDLRHRASGGGGVDAAAATPDGDKKGPRKKQLSANEKRKQILEAQRDKLRQIQEKSSSNGNGNGAATTTEGEVAGVEANNAEAVDTAAASSTPVVVVAESVQEGWETVARVLNSLRIVTPVLLTSFLHARRNDHELVIQRSKLNAKRSQAYFLGEAVYDLVQIKTLKRQHSLLRDLYALLGLDPNCVTIDHAADWTTVLDKHMQIVAHDATNLSDKPSWAGVLPLDALGGDVDDATKQTAAAKAVELDAQFELAADKDEEQHELFVKAIESLRDRLDSVLKERFPDARLSLYGSCLSDLCLGHDADVDLSLFLQDAADAKAQFEAGTLPVNRYQKSLYGMVMQVKRKLDNVKDTFADLEAVTRARVPVLKGKFVTANNPYSSDGSLHFDICFLNDIAVVNSGLLREYSVVDARARHLMMAVKRWAKDNRVGSAQTNTLSSYTWMNLVVFYLQSVGLLPNLQSDELFIKAGVAPDSDDYWSSVNSLKTTYLKWEQVKSHWEPNPALTNVSVTELLYGFFTFYDSTFPTPFYMASIKRGSNVTFPKTVFAKRTLSYAIEDPFETYDSHCPHNLGIHGNEMGFRRIASLIKAASSHLRAALLSPDSDSVERLWPEPAPAGEVATDGAKARGRGGRNRDGAGDKAAGGRQRGGGADRDGARSGRGGGGRGGRGRDSAGGGRGGAGGRSGRKSRGATDPQGNEAAQPDAAVDAAAPSDAEDVPKNSEGDKRTAKGSRRGGRGRGGPRDAPKADAGAADSTSDVTASEAKEGGTDGATTTDDEGTKLGGGGGAGRGGRSRRSTGGRGGGGRSSRKAVDPPADGAVAAATAAPSAVDSEDEGANGTAKQEKSAGGKSNRRRGGRGGGRKSAAAESGDEAGPGADAPSGDEEGAAPEEGKPEAGAAGVGARRGRGRGGRGGRGGAPGTEPSDGEAAVSQDAPADGDKKKENNGGEGRARGGRGRGRGGRGGGGRGGGGRSSKENGQVDAPASNAASESAAAASAQPASTD